jgi:anthranilate phosphoribosyltransferase
LRDGEISEYEIHPEDFGMVMASNRALKVANAAESKTMVLGVLDNEPGAARDIVILNAGAALYAANVADSILAGVALARKAIRSGAARDKLAQLVAATGRA